jgi:maltooligosyltrehalose trehalohydrolase
MSSSRPMETVFEQPVHGIPGARLQPDGSVEWRLWAPKHENVALVLDPEGQRSEHRMVAERDGYHRLTSDAVGEAARYVYRLPDGRELPDPASRWQPDGVHAPSALFFPERFRWSDAGWRGVPREELVIYELHVGTFTAEGRSMPSCRVWSSSKNWA